MSARADRSPNLVAWQWQLYADNHRARRNLLIHILTVPLFWLGLLTVISSTATGFWWGIPAGIITMAIVMRLQGAGHAREATPPVPFDGPLDVIKRILVEQLVTFPRFVLSGKFTNAWKQSAA